MVQKFEDHVKNVSTKRKRESTGNESNEPKLKQSNLFGNGGKLKESVNVTQSQVDRLVFDYVITSPHPFSEVEKESFKNLIKGLQPSKTVMSRPTLMKKLDEEFGAMSKKIKENMQLAEYVCTTADCWTAFRRSYIGITAHWIDPQTLERKSAALACRRIKGRHTYDKLTEAMIGLFKEYRIQNKNIKTITDNGSNFVKAFRVNAAPEGNDEEENEEEITVESVTGILDERYGHEDSMTVDYLPSHQRCASHTLNLVATTDAIKALETDKQYKKIHRSSFAKCQALWNRQNQSATSADTIKDTLGRYLVCPNATRWNSTFRAMECILKLLKEKQPAVDAVCDDLQLPRLLPREIEFISEYCSVTGCVAIALDILQGERYMYMGFYTPTICKLQSKLDAFSNLSHCQPLVTAVKNGVTARFQGVFDDDNIMAAMLHPQFKTDWAWIKTNADKREHIVQKIATLMGAALHDIQPNEREVQPPVEPGSTDHLLNFFQEDEQDIVAGVQDQTVILRKYLASPVKNLSLLNDFITIKTLFIKTNTAIPSSAPVERLFSAAKHVLTDKRGCIKDENFEKQLLIKVNVHTIK